MGYLEFREAVPSDHRALWLDISAHYVCPLEQDAIKQLQAWHLHCKDLQVVTKYNELLWESLQLSDLAHRASNLAQQVTVRLSQSQKVEYKSIEQQPNINARWKITVRRSRLEWCLGVHKCPRQSTKSCTGKDFKVIWKDVQLAAQSYDNGQKRWHQQSPR